MNEREAIEMALDLIESEFTTKGENKYLPDEVIEALRQALAQPEQEPVATISVRWHEPVGKVAFVLEVDLPVGIHKVYTTPQQRTWVGLTDEEIKIIKTSAPCNDTANCGEAITFGRAIEAKLKKKNA